MRADGPQRLLEVLVGGHGLPADFQLQREVTEHLHRSSPGPGANVGTGEPSPGADVGMGEPSPGTDVGTGEPSPGADVGTGEPSPGTDVGG